MAKVKEIWILTFQRDRPTHATSTFREVCTVVFDNHVEYHKARTAVSQHPRGRIILGESSVLTDAETVAMMLRLPYVEV